MTQFNWQAMIERMRAQALARRQARGIGKWTSPPYLPAEPFKPSYYPPPTYQGEPIGQARGGVRGTWNTRTGQWDFPRERRAPRGAVVMKKGGIVKKSGTYRLEKGEKVIPAKKTIVKPKRG